MAEEHLPPPQRARRSSVVAIWIIAGALSLAVATSLFLHYSKLALFAGGGCKEQTASEIPSPDGKLKAIIFTRDCGATTRASTHVSVVRRNEPGSGPASGDVLAGYEYPWNGPSHKIGAEWTSPHALNVHYANDVELTHLNNQVGPVHVHFELRQTSEPNQ